MWHFHLAESSSGCAAYIYNATESLLTLGLCFVKSYAAHMWVENMWIVGISQLITNSMISKDWFWCDHNFSTVLKTHFKLLKKTTTKKLWKKLCDTDAKDLCLRHCTVAIVTCRGIHGIWTWKWRAGSWRKTPPGQGQPGRWLKRHKHLWIIVK